MLNLTAENRLQHPGTELQQYTKEDQHPLKFAQ